MDNKCSNAEVAAKGNLPKSVANTTAIAGEAEKLELV